jgi:protein tyrosine phosphatase (PTP) superfamily phosphohydrolase (DUF442 family)
MSLQEITNFFEISPSLGTSGMPHVEHFALIAASGYEVVINLARSESPGQLADEARLVQAAGMEYIHIPVAWQAPSLFDVRRFFAALEDHRDRRVFVHCVMNYRVSVFVYLYRVLRLVVAEPLARADLNRIWSPDGVWADLIAQAFDTAGSLTGSEQP